MTPATPAARTRWQPGVAAWALWALVLLGLAATAWLDQLLRQAGRPDLIVLNASGVPFVLAAVTAATVGAVVVSRCPAHRVGWLLLGLGLSVPGFAVVDGYSRSGLLARPGSLPAARYLAVYSPPCSWPGWPAPASCCC